MPIITIKNGYYPTEEVVFVGPDASGEFTCPQGSEGELPSELNPLFDPGLRKVIAGVIPSDEKGAKDPFVLDYTGVRPENIEQVLVVSGHGLYKKKIYLSKYGEGSATTQRPQPMPRPGEAHVYSFAPIRETGLYRRERVGGKVVGWVETRPKRSQKEM
jgi:hypothetical protein